MKRIAILYSELADYSVACFKELSNHDVRLLLIHWPINPEAPFQFDLSFCESVSKNKLKREDLLVKVSEFKPELILVSGWMDKDYVSVTKAWYGKIPTVLSMDNHWNGSLKQRIATILAPFSLLRTFSNAFVPGMIQHDYARKLGFSKDKIQTGFYAADTKKFEEMAEQIGSQQNQIPKRFLYLGRYVEHKGIFDMWNAFIEFHKSYPEWELWCVGTGDQYEKRVRSEGIKHFGFVQPSDLMPILRECSVYILPSHFEPWGVSVQEMAIAGFPLLLSNEIGSKEAFLMEGVNGYTFPAGDTEQIKSKMEAICNQSDQEFNSMRVESQKLGLTNSPKTWSEKLLNFLSP